MRGEMALDSQFATTQQYLDSPASLAAFKFEIERYDYGYGTGHGSRIFAMTVVSIYALILTCHFLYVALSPLLSRTTIPTVSSWERVADLVLLAWNSMPTEHERLSQATLNVRSTKDWAINIGIRADTTGLRRRARLVTRADGGEFPGKNVAYF